MKKLGCAQCGGMKKYGDGGTKKTTKKTTKKPYDPFAPQVVSVVKNGKTVYQEKPLKGDKGDSGEKYKYKQQTGGVSIQLPKYSNDPRTNQGRILKTGGMLIDPEKKAARQAKRAEKKITRQIKKSVMNSGKIVKAKRGGTKK